MSLQPTVFPVVRPDDRSFPPTAQPLTVVSEASVGQAAYGGGGGGGGSNTPNPSFSSIQMNANGSIMMNYGVGVGTYIGYNTDNTGNNYVNVTAYPTYSMAPNTVSSMTGTKVSLINQNGVFDGLQCGGIIFDGNGQGSSATTPCMASDVTGVLNVWASNVSISSMTISSINGAVPGTGGSIPPNLVTSSIQSLGSGQDLCIVGDNSAAYVFDAPGSILDIQFRPTSGLIGCIGANGTVVWIGGQPGQEGGTPVSISSLYTTVAEVAGANISSLNVSSINGAAPGGGSSVTPSTFSTLVGLSTINSGAPAPLTVVGELVVTNTIGCSALSTISITSVVPGGDVVVPLLASSNLTISSINNAAYPPAAGAYPKVSTINVGGGGGQTYYSSISTNSIAQFSDTFTIQQGHLYQISFNYQLQPTATAVYGQFGTFTVNGSVAAAPARSVTQDLGISTLVQQAIVFAGTGNGTGFLQCETNTTTPCILDLSYNTTNIELIDFGTL